MPFDEGNESVNGEFSTFGPALENEEGIDGSDDPQQEDDDE